MATKTNMTIRIEPDIKAQASTLFNSLGLDMSTATGIFFRQAIRCNGIPFEIRGDMPNDETIEAIKEVKMMKENPSLGKAYSDVDEMMKELLS